MRRFLLRRIVVAAVSAILLVAAIQAQNPRGSLRGTVKDATGGRVSSAKVVVQLLGSSVQRETASEERGELIGIGRVGVGVWIG